MSFDLRSKLKQLYYRIHRERLAEGVQLSLGYIVHTEKIYRDESFDPLLRFCRDYRDLTGVSALCPVLPGNNPRVLGKQRALGLSPDSYVERIRAIGKVATLGYHGHFWIDPDQVMRREAESSEERWHSEELEVRGSRFMTAPFVQQFEAEQRWFSEHGIDLHGIYSAGWWMMMPTIVRTLLRHGYQYDFSFSWSPWFCSPWSHRFMVDNCVRPGQPFRFKSEGRELLCVQNLIGCHQSPLVEDFTRNLNAMLSPERKAVIGVVNTHDYDLDATRTLQCLRYARDSLGARFFGYDEIVSGAYLTAPERLSVFPLFAPEPRTLAPATSSTCSV